MFLTSKESIFGGKSREWQKHSKQVHGENPSGATWRISSGKPWTCHLISDVGLLAVCITVSADRTRHHLFFMSHTLVKMSHNLQVYSVYVFTISLAGKHEEKQEEGGIVTKNFTKKIQWVFIQWTMTLHFTVRLKSFFSITSNNTSDINFLFHLKAYLVVYYFGSGTWLTLEGKKQTVLD